MSARALLLWLILSVGGLVLGGISLCLGGFIQGNIRTELSSQQITFTAEDRLSDAEWAIPSLIENAGQPLLKYQRQTFAVPPQVSPCGGIFVLCPCWMPRL